MRFNDIRIELSERILECRKSSEIIKKIENNPHSTDPLLLNSFKTLKGQIFVLMYGTWEYTVHNSLDRVIQEIGASNTTFSQLKRSLLSIFLHSHIESMIATNSKKWQKRAEVFEIANSAEIASTNGYIDVTSGINIKSKQLGIIQNCYNISSPILPAERFRGRLDELIENRNAIAHGRERASSVGGRYTYSELDERLNDLNQLCLFFISKLEDYLLNEEFKN